VGDCCPTEAFEFDALGFVVAESVLAGEEVELCDELIVLEFAGLDVALELWVPLISLDGLLFGEVEAALLGAAALLAPAAAPVVSEGLPAEGPELLLPAPQ
jgi:hypothetical protein